MTWSKQIDDFAKDDIVILPTVRGYPPSDAPLDENAYEGHAMASDIVALLDHLKFDKAVFAVGDIGGIIVQKLA